MSVDDGTVERRVARQVILGLLAVHGTIAAINLSPLIRSYSVASVLDVNAEATFVVWLSSATLLGIAAATALLAARADSSKTRRGWAIVAACFVLLSIDETASLHELAGEWASRVLEISWLPGLYAWVIVVAPVAAAGAVWLARWFAAELGVSTWSGRLAITAIGVWMTVPIFELFDVPLDGARWLVVLEETVEGVGGALMLGAVAYEVKSRRPSAADRAAEQAGVLLRAPQ
jgi:hypothetical protein